MLVHTLSQTSLEHEKEKLKEDSSLEGAFFGPHVRLAACTEIPTVLANL